MKTFMVKVGSKLIKRQEIWLEEYQGYDYDAVKKYVENLAEKEIELCVKNIKRKRKTLKLILSQLMIN